MGSKRPPRRNRHPMGSKSSPHCLFSPVQPQLCGRVIRLLDFSLYLSRTVRARGEWKVDVAAHVELPLRGFGIETGYTEGVPPNSETAAARISA